MTAETESVPRANDSSQTTIDARVGTHLIVELWNGERLDEAKHIEDVLVRACSACGATYLWSHFHDFGDQDGVTGVVILSESHISIHTWPEYRYAALDLFMCSNADPHLAVPLLESGFQTSDIRSVEFARGGEACA